MILHAIDRRDERRSACGLYWVRVENDAHIVGIPDRVSCVLCRKTTDFQLWAKGAPLKCHHGHVSWLCEQCDGNARKRAGGLRTPQECERHGAYEGQPTEGIYVATCPACNAAIAALAETIEPTTSTSDQIACPKCGHLCMDLWDYRMRDGESVEDACEGCGAGFRLTCSIHVHYRAELVPT